MWNMLRIGLFRLIIYIKYFVISCLFTVLKHSENVNINESEDDSNCLTDQATALDNKQVVLYA